MKRGLILIMIGVTFLICGSVLTEVSFNSGSAELSKHLIQKFKIENSSSNTITINATKNNDIRLILWTEPEEIPVKISIMKNGMSYQNMQFTKEFSTTIQTSKGDFFKVKLQDTTNDPVTASGVLTSNLPASYSPHNIVEFTTAQYHEFINQVWIGVGLTIGGIAVIISGLIIFFLDRRKTMKV